MSSLSIVLPAYNEEENVENAVESVSEVAQRLGQRPVGGVPQAESRRGLTPQGGPPVPWDRCRGVAHATTRGPRHRTDATREATAPAGMDYEIILVNDGSTDRTGEIGRELEESVPNFRLVEHYPNRGYGGALKAGFEAATKDLIAFYPADAQFDFSEIEQMLKRLREEADIVCGYRVNRQDNVVRRLNAFGWNMLVRLLFGYLCRDIDCGFKLFRREVLDHVNLVSDGAMIDTEFLAGAKARGFRIVEVPLTHFPRQAGEATGANLGVILKAFRDLVRFRRRLNRELREER